jgi:hypothetical protein
VAAVGRERFPHQEYGIVCLAMLPADGRNQNRTQNKTPQTHSSHGTLGRTALPRKLLNHNLLSGGTSVNGPIV